MDSEKKEIVNFPQAIELEDFEGYGQQEHGNLQSKDLTTNQ